jgi:hypothetical protein
MKIPSTSIAGALVATALFLATDVKSQTTPAHAFVLSLAVDAGIPTGNASTYSGYTLGGDIRLQYGVTDNFAVTFTTGGYHFFPKKIPGSNSRYSSYGVGPIKAGIKEFFTKNIYFGAEAGVGVEVTEQGFNGGQKKLLLSPALGYANKRWDIAIRYESYSGQNNNYGQVALRFGYGFRL